MTGEDFPTGELGALEDILFTLYNEPRDGSELLDRFGSYRGIFDASENELKEFGLTERAARFFVYCKRLIVQALRRELAHAIVKSERDATKFASAYFFGENRPSELLLCLDGGGAVRNVIEIDSAHALRQVVGNAALCRAERVLWMRYSPSGTRARIDGERKRDVARAQSALDKLGCELTDYIEYRPPLYYSAVAAARGEGMKSCAAADKTPYCVRRAEINDNGGEEIRYGSRIVRYGRNACSDGARQVYERVLQSSVR